MDYNEYSNLAGVGFKGAPDATAPEDEFFKSVYIAGKTRKNHINVEEQAGKLQVRGLEYNLEQVYMAITHTKEILVREPDAGARGLYSCFSFKSGNAPWHGTTFLEDGRQRPCPPTSAERSVNDYCCKCRGQILVAGIYCKPDGTPVMDANTGKPVFVFLRGKGTKYGNISDYLGEMYKLDLPPVFEPSTPQSLEFEKQVVNHKRFVTKITIGKYNTQYGDKDIFVLEKGPQIEISSVKNILQIAKQTVEKFEEKFDWSRNAQVAAPQADGVLPMDANNQETSDQQNSNTTESESTSENEEQKEEKPKNTFSFDNIEF